MPLNRKFSINFDPNDKRVIRELMRGNGSITWVCCRSKKVGEFDCVPYPHTCNVQRCQWSSVIVSTPSEPKNSLTERLAAALGVIMDQIDSAGPTEMIAAVFDGRELQRARDLLKEGR